VEKIKHAITSRPTGERKLGFIMFIGVRYKIVGDGAVHITYFPYSTLNVPVGTAIPDGTLMDLPHMAFLPGEAD
jgi:hypothetical protein